MGWQAVLWTAVVLTVALIAHSASAVPIKRGPPHPDPVEGGSPKADDMGTGLEYDGYLRQVVEALESDEDFRKKLETANISDIKSGEIAMHLELVNHSIRTKLDEIKRLEVKRLQELALIKMKSMSGVGVNRMDIPAHLDLRNPHSFEMKDLQNLIKKATNDLQEVDEKRREEFKTYEMEKEAQYQEKLKTLDQEQKQQEEEKHRTLQEKHKQHDKINHPGSKDQFEEVWEKQDHLDDQDFDPKTFFFMHDLNGDKMWDITEVEAVLQRELDKVYDARNSPEEDDPNERFEEMNRMREHVFKEIDTNKDFMITLDEFIAYTGKNGDSEKFKEDEGWETLDETDKFSDEEFQEYLRQYHPDIMPPGHEDNSLQFQPENHVPGQQQQQQQGQFNQGHHAPPQPAHGQPVQGQPMQGQPMQGQPIQGQHMQGQHMQGQPMQGQPMQGQHMQGQPMQGQHMQGQPMQGQHMQGQPIQGQGQPLQNQSPSP